MVYRLVDAGEPPDVCVSNSARFRRSAIVGGVGQGDDEGVAVVKRPHEEPQQCIISR